MDDFYETSMSFSSLTLWGWRIGTFVMLCNGKNTRLPQSSANNMQSNGWAT